jgi:hypothetical protein
VIVVTDAFDRALEKILTEHGPVPEDDIVRRLHTAGASDPAADVDAVLYETDFPARQLNDERWVWLPALLAGRVFTHRLRADEVDHDVLTVAPDLEPVAALCGGEHYQQLADGSPVEIVLAGFDEELLEQRGVPAEVIDPNGALLLAAGTLARLGVSEGDVVGVRLTAHGLVVEAVASPSGAHAGLGARLAATLDADEPVFFDAAVWTVCAEDPAVFTEPLAPLSEIVDDFGLARDGDWLAPAGFDFDRWGLETGSAALAERHDLDPDDAFVVYTLLKFYGQVSWLLHAAADTDTDAPLQEALTAAGPEGDRLFEVVGELGAGLADPLLAEVFLEETVGADRDGAAALGLFAEALEPKVPRAARVALRWLRAVALQLVGDIGAGERELLAAESMDADWPLTLLDLARIASDRGDAERGLALLHRAGAAPEHPLVTLLQQYRAEPRRDLGRNEPCWCGSGRKYKKCHLGREQLPLADRAGWLYAKASEHVLLAGWNDLLVATSYERHRYTDQDDPDAPGAALADPLALDAVLFEGGAFAEFLDMRGSLLPDDERGLAEQWLLVNRSVFEVEQIHPGHGLTLRDVRTGDTHEVRERSVSRRLKPGQLVCTRVVPAGETMVFFGGLEPVALHERDALIDLLVSGADPMALVAQLSRRLATPLPAEGDPPPF